MMMMMMMMMMMIMMMMCVLPNIYNYKVYDLQHVEDVDSYIIKHIPHEQYMEALYVLFRSKSKERFAS